MNISNINKRESIFRLHSFCLRFVFNKLKSQSPKYKSISRIKLPPLSNNKEADTSKLIESIYIKDVGKLSENPNVQINQSQ